MITIYLDNCCYNRPFDDRSNIKNYLEREAILIIMQMAYDGKYRVIGSEVLEREMAMISNEEKKRNVKALYCELKSDVIKINNFIAMRAGEIMEQSSIRAFDSLHLASAEMGADVLLTTDIKFLRAANRLGVGIKVQNPIDFILEVNEYGSNN